MVTFVSSTFTFMLKAQDLENKRKLKFRDVYLSLVASKRIEFHSIITRRKDKSLIFYNLPKRT